MKYLLCIICVLFISCSEENTSEDRGTPPEVFQNYSETVTVYTMNAMVILESNNIPNHNSPYFPQGDSRKIFYDGENQNYNQNPNSIRTQNLVYKIPVDPTEAVTKTKTSLGPIGISVNGVALYNQFAGPNDQPLTNEINSFDQFNGHPQQQGQYHYHVEPLYITSQNGRDALIGFLLDGFPVYGPLENNEVIKSSDLDQYHGHNTATKDYPNGIYHYHITDDAPYINGGYFYGSPGTVSQ